MISLRSVGKFWMEKTDDIPFDFMGTKAYIAKLCDEQVKRVDGKCGNIVYNKERLY